MDKLYLKHPVIVEGKYDKIKLSAVVASTIIVLNGFSIFKSEEKRILIKTLCSDGAIMLTDSDNAGMFIRRKLKGYFPDIILYNVFTPQLKGKEKRKSKPSASGFLGVEGIDAVTLYELLKPFEISAISGKAERRQYTKTDFFEKGLSGKENSKEMRDRLSEKLGLPCGMTANALLEAVNLMGAEI